MTGLAQEHMRMQEQICRWEGWVNGWVRRELSWANQVCEVKLGEGNNCLALLCGLVDEAVACAGERTWNQEGQWWGTWWGTRASPVGGFLSCVYSFKAMVNPRSPPHKVGVHCGHLSIMGLRNMFRSKVFQGRQALQCSERSSDCSQKQTLVPRFGAASVCMEL